MSASLSTNSADLSIPFNSEIDRTDVLISVDKTTQNTTKLSEGNDTSSSIINKSCKEKPEQTQLIPQWVYIHPSTKVNTTSNTSVLHPNIIVSGNLPQNKISNIATGVSTINSNKNSLIKPIAIPTNQGIILTQPINNTAKPQHLVIQKPTGNVQALPVVPISVSSTVAPKGTVLQFAMIKSNDSNKVTKIKTSENIKLISSSNTLSLNSQKYVIAPMPKVTSNRLPITATTNSVQPKIAFMPISTINSAKTKPKSFNFKFSNGQLKEKTNGKLQTWGSKNKQKMFNFKIADGLVQNDNGGKVKLLCSGSNDASDKDIQEKEKLLYNDIICLDNSPKTQISFEKLEEIEKKSKLKKHHKNRKNTSSGNDEENYKRHEHKKKEHKDSQKNSKHGVSILKKNISNLDRNFEKSTSSLIIRPLPNSHTNVSDDGNVKDGFASDERRDDFLEKSSSQRTERRRKSNFSCRVDYDEIMEASDSEIWNENKYFDNYKQFENSDITLTKLDENSNKDDKKEIEKESIKSEDEDMIEIELIKDDNKETVDKNDINKILRWENGIGTLPGSELKFQVNDYGLLEYLTREEVNQILASKKIESNEQTEQKSKKQSQEDICCHECGCFGLRSDFVSSKYCSYDCQENGIKRIKMKKRKKGSWMKKHSSYFLGNNENSNFNKTESGSDEENTSNENSTDKFTYPWNCSKKGFSWSKYLDHVKAKAAPVKLFKDPFPYTRNAFRVGWKLEGIDPQHPSRFCVLTVAEVIGYRIRLSFDGYPENYDFWVNADSMDIFPVGWCEKYGRTLQPPLNYTKEEFNWMNYLKQTKSTAAPKQYFVNRAGNAVCPNGFRIGMKLEAVDRKNTSLICVATVVDMMDNRILVHFDSWNDIYDYWADPTSPFIHPVGWCDQNGHKLTPPSTFRNPKTFKWEKYLKETKSVPVPARAFKQRPVCGFKKSMRLEAVDKRVPQLIRVATVEDIRDHQICIRFDGWPDRYNFWVDDDSPDIHPVGWCQKTGHPIEPPLTPDDVYDFLECPTVGCRGLGHIEGPKYATHTSQKFCPYAEENIDKENVLPDRLLAPDCKMEAIIPISVLTSKERKDKSPADKSKLKARRPPKIPRLDSVKQEWSESDDSKPPKRKHPKIIKSESPPTDISSKSNIRPLKNGYAQSFPPHDPSWFKHSRYLRQFIRHDSDPRDWSEDDVLDFVASFPSCQKHIAVFDVHRIDGEAFLMLTQQDLTDILKFKLGPAIKLYNAILLMRRNMLNM